MKPIVTLASVRLAAIILLGASISCLAPHSCSAQTKGKDARLEKGRAAFRQKILAAEGPDYLSKGTGTCQAGVAFADIDINQVRARLYNTGGLFWKGAGPLYNVPQSTPANAIFAAGLWIGGLVDGKLRAVVNEYGPWEFWPGPLDENGDPPDDCSQYDRMYKVSRDDIRKFEEDGTVSPDLRDWPKDLGAPVIDGDGNLKNYDLTNGDRPDLIGDQMIWWVMNDKGNEHGWSLTPPMEIEVRASVFAFVEQTPMDYTTVYQYEIINHGSKPIEKTHFGIWTDPDLGDAGDDYVGSDTTRNLGFAWNGDDFDGGSDGYGDRPPAVGFQFVEGPIADQDSLDNDRDGIIDESDERHGMTTFLYYNGDSTVQGNPNGGDDAYRFLRGLWRDDVPVTYGGSGRGFSNIPTRFMFTGDPPAFWSEEDVDNAGNRNTPSDRRFVMSSGAFTIEPGETQRVTFAVIFSQGQNRYDSLRKLKDDARYVQIAFNEKFQFPDPPHAPQLVASSLDGEVILSWENLPTSNNYLDSYSQINPLLPKDVIDRTYSFEGYEILEFDSQTDSEGEVIATFDVANGVKTVVDITDFQTNMTEAKIVVRGTDTGIRHSMRVPGLDNYRDYYFGIRAYGHNANSRPFIRKGPVNRVTVRPSRIDARNEGTRIAEGATDATFTQQNGRVTRSGRGNGRVWATVVEPSKLTGDTYRVRFYEQNASEDPTEPRIVTNYDVLRSDGSKAFDGNTAVMSFGGPAPQTEDVLLIDGLSFSITGPDSNADQEALLNLPGDVFAVNTNGYAVETNVQEVARDALDLISIVPNPYKGASDYELSGLADVARFTNLPERATIRVFNLSGVLVRQIEKIGPETSLNWDLLTDTDLPLASGMYLVHVDVPDVGSKVIKFGLVKKRIQLQLY